MKSDFWREESGTGIAEPTGVRFASFIVLITWAALDVVIAQDKNIYLFYKLIDDMNIDRRNSNASTPMAQIVKKAPHLRDMISQLDGGRYEGDVYLALREQAAEGILREMNWDSHRVPELGTLSGQDKERLSTLLRESPAFHDYRSYVETAGEQYEIETLYGIDPIDSFFNNLRSDPSLQPAGLTGGVSETYESSISRLSESSSLESDIDSFFFEAVQKSMESLKARREPPTNSPSPSPPPGSMAKNYQQHARLELSLKIPGSISPGARVLRRSFPEIEPVLTSDERIDVEVLEFVASRIQTREQFDQFVNLVKMRLLQGQNEQVLIDEYLQNSRVGSALQIPPSDYLRQHLGSVGYPSENPLSQVDALAYLLEEIDQTQYELDRTFAVSVSSDGKMMVLNRSREVSPEVYQQRAELVWKLAQLDEVFRLVKAGNQLTKASAQEKDNPNFGSEATFSSEVSQGSGVPSNSPRPSENFRQMVRE